MTHGVRARSVMIVCLLESMKDSISAWSFFDIVVENLVYTIKIAS